MAYENKPIRILAGGLNKAASGDVIADDDSQELVNFHTDSQGALRSRKGHRTICSVGGRVVNMIRGLGSRWQASASGVFKECGHILPGGDPCGLMAWQSFLWALGDDQRKSDGTSNWRWIPEAPTGKPTAAPSSTIETLIVDFTAGFTVDPDDATSYNPTLQIFPTTDDVSYSAVKDAVLDLGTAHSLDDVHRIVVWAKNWNKIKEVVFEVDCNDGTFLVDCFTARMSKKNINAGQKEEITFYLRARPQNVDIAAQDKKRYGWFDRIGSTAGKGWKTVTKVRVKITFTEATKMRFMEWVCVGDEENTLEGDDLQVCYTYTTAAGHESNPSDFSDPITCNRNGIAVTDMIPSTDPQVIGQNVYVTGATLGAVLQVNRDGPIVGTNYSVIASFDEMTDFGKQLEIDHDDPPTNARGLGGPYFARAIAYGRSQVWWSKLDKPYAFPGADDPLDGNWNKVDEAVGNLLAHTMRVGTMWFYGENGVIVLIGDPDDVTGSFHRGALQMGIASQQGVVAAPEGDYANFGGGIYLTANGESARKISYKLNPLFDVFNREKAALGYRNAVVWASDGSNTYKFDVLTDRWFEDSRAFSCFYGDGGPLLGALTSGEIVELESGFTDNGAAIPLRWTSKSYDAGLQDDEKVWGDFHFWANTGGATLLIQAILSSPNQVITLGSVSSTSEQRFVLPFNSNGEGLVARRCAIRVIGATAGAECLLHSMELWWYPKAREGKSFDTGEIDLGDHRVKVIREMILDVDNPASATLTVKSDRPQPMANRAAGIIIPATTDRRMQPIVFDQDSEIIGRLFRFIPHGSDLRCYGGKVLYQAFGTYLEEDEYYDSNPLDFGTEKVKLLHEAQIVYAGAGGRFSIKTDLPGDVLASRRVADLPPTSGEQSSKQRVEGNIKGRLFDIHFAPFGPTRIEVIRLEIKVVGAPNAGAWNWVSLPLRPTTDGIWAPFGFPADQPG